MNAWAFISAHPIWSFLALLVVTSMVETIGRSIASAIGRRQ